MVPGDPKRKDQSSDVCREERLRTETPSTVGNVISSPRYQSPLWQQRGTVYTGASSWSRNSIVPRPEIVSEWMQKWVQTLEGSAQMLSGDRMVPVSIYLVLVVGSNIGNL